MPFTLFDPRTGWYLLFIPNWDLEQSPANVIFYIQEAPASSSQKVFQNFNDFNPSKGSFQDVTQVDHESLEDDGADVPLSLSVNEPHILMEVNNIGWLGNIFLSVSPHFLIKVYFTLIFYLSHKSFSGWYYTLY